MFIFTQEFSRAGFLTSYNYGGLYTTVVIICRGPNANMASEFSRVHPGCPVIDAHVHLLPEQILQTIQEWFKQETSWTLPDVTTAEIAEFIETHLDGAVFFPYAHKAGVARSMNDTAAHWQDFLTNAIGLATVHVEDEDPAAIIQEGLEAGLQGIKLHCPVEGFPPDDLRLDPVYELAIDYNLPIIFHASSHPFYRGNENVGPKPIVRLLRRFPNLRICIAHLGLFETHDFLDIAEWHDTLFFDTAMTAGGKIHDLIGIREGEFPIQRIRKFTDRIMFGSDYPILPISVTYADTVEATTTLFQDNQESIFYENAKRFYGM